MEKHRKSFHTIAKQVFEAEVASSEDPVQIKNDFSSLVHDTFLEVLEGVFDELCLPTKSIRIDKISISLEGVKYPFQKVELRDMFRTQLRRELNFAIISLQNKKTIPSTYTGELKSYKAEEEELLLHYLEYGYLPWWAVNSSAYKWHASESVKNMLDKKAISFYVLLKKISKSPKAIERIYSLLSEEQRETVFQEILKRSNNDSALVAKSNSYILEQSSGENIRSLFKAKFEFFISVFLIKKQQVDNVQELLKEYVRYMLSQAPISARVVYKVFPFFSFLIWLEENFPTVAIKTRVNQLYEKLVDSKKTFPSFETLKEYFFESKNIHMIDDFYEKLLIKTPKENTSNPSSVEIKQVTPIRIWKNKLIEEVLYRYLRFGEWIYSSEWPAPKEVEKVLQYWHTNEKETIVKFVDSIDTKNISLFVFRLQFEAPKVIADSLLTYFLEKELAIKTSEGQKYKEKILKLFFQKGIPPWEAFMVNNTSKIEKLILDSHELEAAYFFRLASRYIMSDKKIWQENIEHSFSTSFSETIKKIVAPEILSVKIKSNKQSKKELPNKRISLPITLDEIGYFLSYYEKEKLIPPQVDFTIEQLIRFFISTHRKESIFYFLKFTNESIQAFLKPIELGTKKLVNELLAEVSTSNSRQTEVKKSLLSEKQPIFINNAGLVLLHPFLGRFFNLCQLTEIGKFKDELAMQRAVLLLHYLVYKDDAPEEHELVLNKILCGVNIVDPIDLSIEITEEERELGESLLEGVIQNWPILKKTSNDNFRVSFLQREGKLIEEEASWRLRVENRGFDVLLDQLPWSIASIKLLAMKKLLSVEWR